MIRFASVLIMLAVFAASSMAQTMMAPAANEDSTGTSGMMAPSPKMAASSDTMASDMSYDSLKKSGKLADVKMGAELRMAKSGGMKVAYMGLMNAESLASRAPTVLFFAADWCPSCQADLKDINANGDRLGTVNVVVVDYDKSSDLKAKYGISVQDTFVQIDSNGAELAIWNGGGVDGILNNLVKAM